VTGLPIYVGIGKHSRYRAEGHKGNWRWDLLLKEYATEDLETYLFPVESQKEALQWEGFLVHIFRYYGVDLYNLTSGGEFCKHVPETIDFCREAAFRGHKERTPEEDVARSEKISRHLKIFRENLTQDALELESNKFREVYEKLAPEIKENMIYGTLLAKQNRSQEKKNEESRKRSESLRIAHSRKTPEEKAATAAKRSKTIQNRSPELEALRGQRISEAKRARYARQTKEERVSFGKSISEAMLAMPKKCRTQAANKAWETRRRNQQKEP